MNNITSFLMITIKMGLSESIKCADIGDHLLPTTSPTNLRPSRKVRDNKHWDQPDGSVKFYRSSECSFSLLFVFFWRMSMGCRVIFVNMRIQPTYARCIVGSSGSCRSCPFLAIGAGSQRFKGLRAGGVCKGPWISIFGDVVHPWNEELMTLPYIAYIAFILHCSTCWNVQIHDIF